MGVTGSSPPIAKRCRDRPPTPGYIHLWATYVTVNNFPSILVQSVTKGACEKCLSQRLTRSVNMNASAQAQRMAGNGRQQPDLTKSSNGAETYSTKLSNLLTISGTLRRSAKHRRVTRDVLYGAHQTARERRQCRLATCARIGQNRGVCWGGSQLILKHGFVVAFGSTITFRIAQNEYSIPQVREAPVHRPLSQASEYSGSLIVGKPEKL